MEDCIAAEAVRQAEMVPEVAKGQVGHLWAGMAPDAAMSHVVSQPVGMVPEVAISYTDLRQGEMALEVASLYAALVVYSDYSARLAAVKIDRSCFFLAFSMRPAVPEDYSGQKRRPQALTQFGMLASLDPLSNYLTHTFLYFYSSL